MKVLAKVDICGRDIKVVEGTAEEFPEFLGGCHGYYDSDSATIYLLEGCADTVSIDTFLHEILHGIFDATGVLLRIQAAEEALGMELGALEEELVRAIMTSIRPTLKSAGWREPKRVGKAPRKPRTKKVAGVRS